MNPVDLGRATRPAITSVSSKFMLAGDTYRQGGELGFDGMDFYAAGRGGVLGEVPADVVVAAFVFFEPGLVHASWARTADVMSRAAAAEVWAGVGHAWARTHLADAEPGAAATVAELGAKVVAATSAAGAPVFAGWRQLPVPDDAPAAALHQLNALRELRAAYHGGAVLAAGLNALEALAVDNPAFAPVFGWNGPLPDAELYADQWHAAEHGTDVAMGRALSVLDEAEQEAFIAGCAALHAVANRPAA